jgi:hypothetical protein
MISSVNGKIVDEPDEPLPQKKEANFFTQQGSSSATQQLWPSQGSSSHPNSQQAPGTFPL